MAHAKSWIGLSLSGLLATSFCAVASPADAPYSSSLYARLGGAAVMTAVIDELIERAAADPKLKRSFDRVDLARVKRLLVEQICSLSGGGCAYSGDSMHDVHAGLGIDQAEFYGLVEDLREAMRHHGVALRERNELLEILAPMKREIVER
jgi:hemoglobin